MNSLQWNEISEQTTPALPSTRPDFWFGAAMVIIGLIIGYIAGQYSGEGLTFARSAPPLVAQAPTPAPAPSAPIPAPGSETASNVIPVDFDRDHIRGSTNATIALIEYSDFECPFCKRVHPTMKQLLQDYGNDVLWVYRHYPLSFHAQAEPAAIASECVNELAGNTAFWKFTDAVFEQSSFDFAALAKQVGTNAGAFQKCVNSGKYQPYVQEQLAQGSASGIQGTPGTIVLNLKTQENRLVSGAVPIDSFKAAIDALLE